MHVQNREGVVTMQKRVSKKQRNPIRRAGCISAVLIIALVILLSIAGSVIISAGILPENSANIIAIAVILITAFVGPIPLIKASGQKPLPIAYAIGGILIILLLLSKLIFWPGVAFGNWGILIAVAVGATLSGFVSARRPKHKR